MEVEAVASNSISNLLISEMLMIFSENFSEVKIHLPTSLMKMMISLVEEVSDMDLVEEWWDMDFLVDSEEDSVKIIKINNKKNKEETEIHSQTLEWWDLDSMMMMISSEVVLEEVLDLKEVSDKEVSHNFNQAVSEEWEVEWVSLSANKQLLKMDVKKQ